MASPEFSEENLCLSWVTESDGRHWQDWWRALPAYQRNSMLLTYRMERRSADEDPRPGYHGRMRAYAAFLPSREELAQEEAIVQSWAAEIRQAALERRPLPLAWEDPEGLFPPANKARFMARLGLACNIAGIIPITAPAPVVEKFKGRRAPAAAAPDPGLAALALLQKLDL